MKKTKDNLKIAKSVGDGNFENSNSDCKGITLIALVITIIVMIILVGVTVNVALNGGLIDKAREAAFKEELTQLKEELERYKAEKLIETGGRFEETSLSANKLWLYYSPEEYLEEGTIEDVMPSISDEMKEKIEVLNGEIMFSGTEKEIAWAKELGVNKTVKIENGVLLSDNDNLSILSEDGTFTVPSTVTAIGEGAFAKTNVKKVVIPYTVKEIAQNAFNGNTTLEEVEFQTKEIDGKLQGVETIGDFAFSSCTKLREIILPATLMHLGRGAFQSCTSLARADFLSENVTLGIYALRNCKALTSVHLPAKLRGIPESTFSGCISLETVEIPTSLTGIGYSAFLDCSKLANIKIPASVTGISSTAFNGCTALKNIEIDPANKTYTIADGILMNKAETSMIFMLEGASAINGTALTVPNKVTDLPSGFLKNFPNITKVIIPSSVNSISSAFFTKNITEIVIDSENKTYQANDKMILSKDGTRLVYYYANEATVDVPENVTTIGSNSLNDVGGHNVTKVELPENLTTIESGAISCPKLANIHIGKKVSSIDPLAFWYNEGLMDITMTIDEGNDYYTFENRALYDKKKTKLVRVFGNIKEFDIPEEVTEIGDQAFRNKYSMTSVIIPNTVTKIDESFPGCIGLTEIIIPNSVGEIGSGCFEGCSKLTKIKINKEKDSIKGSPWKATIGERAVEWQ